MASRPSAAFAQHSVALLRALQRPTRHSRLRLVCSATTGGRGAWDLPETPGPPHSRRPARRDDGDERGERPYSTRSRGASRGAEPRRWNSHREHRDGNMRGDHRGGRERSEPREWDAQRERRGGNARGDYRGGRERSEPREWDAQRERRSGNARRDQRSGRFGGDNWGERRGERDREQRWPARHGENARSERWEPRRREGFNEDRWGESRTQEQWAGRRDEHVYDEEPSEIQLALAAEDDDLLYGVSPVLHALRCGRRGRFEKLFVQERGRGGGAGPARKAGNEAAVERVLTLATGLGIPVQRLGKGDLNVLAGQRPHQGLVLQCGKLDYQELKEMPKPGEKRECWLVLDEVSDPQNAGALLRSAYFLGADGVIACKRNSTKLTPVVSKASAGALEAMPVYGVSSMPRFLRAARRDGWRVIGTALGDGAVDAKTAELDSSSLVVMGSEGHGLRTMVRDECDLLVRIRGREEEDDAEDVVDSLNVSVAGAVTLFQLLGR